MKRRITLSGENKNLEDIIDFYHLCKRALLVYKERIEKGLEISEEWIGLTPTELQQYFQDNLKELENLICLDLLVAVEAKLRIDYLSRVYNRKKDSLSRIFRAIYKERGEHASLEHDILENWKQQYPKAKSYISDYKSTLQFRHWLAHGRYWTPKLGRKYDLPTVYTVCLNLIDCLGLEQ
ncbi:hypothetical protein HNQ34_003322 [Anoxybacillus tepidamans]|uniref:Uncharacterized protein n=1 Tax=Anoxybacteroides tepidamans TaxID=265948 RepID=A0A7W8MWR4_9BACL|nr:hypothetical protein [Anoxybacillus tepidamans]MBB5326203.1 hypothetical protein [Anoxybacillus tepidamans]